jgi:hypothetical protein
MKLCGEGFIKPFQIAFFFGSAGRFFPTKDFISLHYNPKSPKSQGKTTA